MLEPLPFAIDLTAPGSASPFVGVSVGLGVLFLGVGAALVATLRRASELEKRGEQEAKAASSPTALIPGPNRIVRGKVELLDDAAAAVRVEIDQDVKNHTSKNSRWHTWEEAGRKVDARPFYLLREDGESVLVEPGEDVFVIDAIETKQTVGWPVRRLRVCEVSPGEEFSAFGNLTQGAHPRARSAYRDGGGGFILKPPRSGRMMLASGDITSRYTERVKYLRLWGGLSLLAWAIFHVALTGPVVRAWLFGEHVQARIVDERTWVTHGKNSTTHHYALTVEGDSGQRWESEVGSRTFAWIHDMRARGMELRVPAISSGDGGYLGTEPRFGMGALFGGFLFFTAAGAAFYAGYGAKLAWYDRKKLSEPGGPGHLP